MQSLKWEGVDRVWIGLGDEETEGRWVWVNDEIADDDDIDWYPSEPDGGSSENCVIVVGHVDWQAADVSCTNEEYTLCEWISRGC